MNAALKARLVKIGNSRGVRIPKVWLEQLALGEEVEMALQADQIIIRSAHRPRHNWEEGFQTMAVRGDDQLLDAPISDRWDQDEWQW